ncbi:putative diguanylate cyclase YdaM (plasmid) [Halomonas sp. THAF12]|nr:putative diguanylate cyclase YdaM [Halomonas sp. THAF12]QFT86983.1 putative diguanylate cyclase YdaM [Halomonas sp. THAF12]QFT87019.1 putative diguanylate cyclase YdaM [Halomonas sp. THAF12]
MTLRGRLLVGAAMLWGVLCVTLLTLGWQAGRILVDETNHQHLRYEAELISNSITYQVDERLDELEQLAKQIPEPVRGALDAQHGHSLSPLFEGLTLFDRDTRVVDAWPIGDGRVGASFPDREYARFMHAFRRPYVSEPFVGRITGSPLVMMLVPLRDGAGRYTGFLGGLVNINESRLFKSFERLRLGDGGYVTITTASGKRLFHPDQEQPIVALPEQLSPVLERALYGWEGESAGKAVTGEAQLVAYRQIWPAGWIVGVHLPQSQAEAPLVAGMQRISFHAWGALVLVLPLVGGLIWLTLRPLTRLAEQVRELQNERRYLLEIPTHMPELRRVIDVINETERERRGNLQDLAEREALLRGTLAASPQGMFVTDSRGQVTFINAALEELLGGDESLDMDTWGKRIHAEDRPAVIEAWHQSLAGRCDFMRQFRLLGAEGIPRWLDVHAGAIHVEGEFIGIVGMVRDITQDRHENALRRWETEHDPLTGLLNRRGLTRYLEEALVEWQKTGTPTAVLLFDLDHFKPVNDQGGHALGDRMLQQVADAVRSVVRSSDHAARQGGDEFAVLLSGCSPDQALVLAEALREQIGSCPVEQGDKRWYVTASIGVSHFQSGEESIKAVLDRADAASYRAKRGGRDRVILDSEEPAMTDLDESTGKVG